MFRTRIRELREAKGFKSQQSFADVFGVAQSTVGNWEAGKREPNYETTIRLANFFGVPVGYLVGEEDQDEYSVRFRDRLELSLRLIRDTLVGDEDCMGDYYELCTLTKSTYPLSLAEACIAADKIGESVSYLLGEDDDNNKKSLDADESAPRDEQDKQIMNLVGQMTVSQKNLLLALLRTAVLQNQGTLASDLASIGGAIPKFEHQGLA